MSLFEEDFDADYDIENVDGVKFGDIFYLDYYGINVFFYVCRTDHHQVAIFELAKKKVKLDYVSEEEKVEIVDRRLVPARKPYIVTENNCWTKSEFFVKTTEEGHILIPIKYKSRIYNEALKLGEEFPITGEYRAVPLADFAKYYYELPKSKKQRKRKHYIN